MRNPLKRKAKQEANPLIKKGFDMSTQAGRSLIGGAISLLNKLGPLYEEREVFLTQFSREAKDPKTREYLSSEQAQTIGDSTLFRGIDAKILKVERELISELQIFLNGEYDLRKKEERYRLSKMLQDLKDTAYQIN